ncbi:hypothetical protein GX51_00680 [Blastomyces parvus]|uniref:Uncharacterized protein n=1 Tax=Blastomyces parvus TaxID=2060905 RepID=A0A2B7XD43_9EURO|nr:hypothetical protein GX51_00680 [Blastomyces parvus]
MSKRNGEQQPATDDYSARPKWAIVHSLSWPCWASAAPDESAELIFSRIINPHQPRPLSCFYTHPALSTECDTVVGAARFDVCQMPNW